MMTTQSSEPRRLKLEERFVPAQRVKAARLFCPECTAEPGEPCIYFRPDREGDPMPPGIFHVERYPAYAD